MSTEDKPQPAADPLADLRAQLDVINSKHASPEALASFDKLMREKGYIKGKPTHRRPSDKKSEQKFAKRLRISPKFVAQEAGLIRYFFMEALRRARYDIVLHEFFYMRTIADILAVTGGRATEFEIKCTRDDYFRDFEKVVYLGGNKPLSKHGCLVKGSTMISKFYFIVPENMIDLSECPEHAGLIWYSMVKNLPVFRVVKHPPYLNKEYLLPGTWQTICKRLQTRCWSLTDQYVNSQFSALKNTANAFRDPQNNPPNSH